VGWNYAETEWIYFGAETDVNEEFAILEILDYFHKRPVVIAIDRKTSAIVQPNEVRKFLRGILGFKNFFIWDQSFSSVIEFSHVGVMRKGYV
jgi:hypothetical protein